jgi:hypothetical protein
VFPDAKESAMSLLERVKRILLTPRQEWVVIDGESTTPRDLYAGYIVPLAAIGPIAMLIGSSIFGIRVPLMGTVRVSFTSAITQAVVAYVLALVGVYLFALIIDWLAPTFGGTRNQTQALKVAAYASTAAWVAGIFNLLPGLRVLTILGLYSLYLLYLGLPVLMKSPLEKAMGYTAVTVLAAIVIFFVIGMITARLTPLGY